MARIAQHPKHLILLEEIAKGKATSLEGGAERIGLDDPFWDPEADVFG